MCSYTFKVLTSYPDCTLTGSNTEWVNSHVLAMCGFPLPSLCSGTVRDSVPLILWDYCYTSLAVLNSQRIGYSQYHAHSRAMLYCMHLGGTMHVSRDINLVTTPPATPHAFPDVCRYLHLIRYSCNASFFAARPSREPSSAGNYQRSHQRSEESLGSRVV